MKRKIKFRGKCAGVWRKGDHISYQNAEVIKAWMGSISPEYTVEPETVGQFTGLKDIDSNDIYEGDILQSIEPNGKTFKYPVGFYDGMFTVRYKNQNFPLEFALRFSKCSVVGNIFDNPELLKGGNAHED